MTHPLPLPAATSSPSNPADLARCRATVERLRPDHPDLDADAISALIQVANDLACAVSGYRDTNDALRVALADAVKTCGDCHGSGTYPWSSPPKPCWTCAKPRQVLDNCLAAAGGAR